MEGADGSGKSNFAKAITNYLLERNLPVHANAEKDMVTHPWRPNRTTAADLLLKLQKRLITDEVYIVDRGELSDIIYRTFDFDKYKALMTLEDYYAHYQYYSHRYLIVHCDSDRSEQLMLARGEDNPVSIQEHQKLRYLFNQIMPIFNSRKFDAARSIENPTYLTDICEGIYQQLLWRGVKPNE